MDNYSNDTKNWLDQRFKETDEERVYYAHQPIYGFRKGHSEPGIIFRYIITYQIMKALSHLKFTSLLDVGGAEGYKAALARSKFDIAVRSADLSREACKRAKEIFDIDGEPVDIHQLPYNDNEFDVVLCSETLEHVSNVQEAISELIRVCSKAVVITVPHEPEKVIERNIKEKIPHAHIHSFNTRSLDFILPIVHKVILRRMNNPFIKILGTVAEAMKREEVKGYPQFLVRTYNFFVPLLRLMFGKRSAVILIQLDDYISNLLPSYSGLIFIILKDGKCYSEYQHKHISISQLLDFKVSYHYLDR